MIYDDDYPKKSNRGENPYYSCAYCGMSDPQINGNVKNHSTYCQYRQFKEFGLPLTHDGYGNEMPKPLGFYLSWDDKIEILSAEGWVITNFNPLILVDESGNKLEGSFAEDMVSAIIYDYEN